MGAQTTTLDSASGDAVAWETNYTWAENPDDVKACECWWPSWTAWGRVLTAREDPNVNHNTAKGMQVSVLRAVVWEAVL